MRRNIKFIPNFDDSLLYIYLYFFLSTCSYNDTNLNMKKYFLFIGAMAFRQARGPAQGHDPHRFGQTRSVSIFVVTAFSNNGSKIHNFEKFGLNNKQSVERFVSLG